GSFVRDDSGNVSVKKVDYTLDNTTVLFDIGGDTGILDSLSNIEDDGIVVNINIGGVVGDFNLKTYTTEDVIGTAGIAFDANGSVAWTTASDGAGAGVGFVKIDDDTWVAAVEQGTTTATQEVSTLDTATNAWVIDTSAANLAAATTQTSVSTLTI